MRLFSWTRKPKMKTLAEESDFGRRFGWFVEREGEKIAELDYIRWDSHAQFWHDYALIWLVAKDKQVEPDADKWCTPKLALRNRRYTDVVISGFLTAHRLKEQGIISIRFASVPKERFEQEKTV